jgi:GMP synthase-like glutamine amidotransferase
MKTFYSHLDYPGYGTIHNLFTRTYGLAVVKHPEDADVIVWNGGEDIATSIYLEHPVMRGIPYTKSYRDDQEIALFDLFKADPTKLLLGICRGAQLLNCLNGGKLWQHVDKHGRSHQMLDVQTGETLEVTSTHHQQMIPAKNDGVLIGISSESSYKEHEEGTETPTPSKDLKVGVDVEIMWYPNTRSLCIQGHPEYVPNSRFSSYTLELMHRVCKESVSFAA